MFCTHLKHTCGGSFCQSCVWTKDNFSGGEQPSVWGAGTGATEDMQGERWHHHFLQGGKRTSWLLTVFIKTHFILTNLVDGK